jgi:hypothetical protein
MFLQNFCNLLQDYTLSANLSLSEISYSLEQEDSLRGS